MRKKKHEAREIPVSFASEESQAAPEEEAQEAAPRFESPADTVGVEGTREIEPSVAAEAEDTVTEFSRTEAELRAQLDALSQDKAALYDQLLRRQAEFENYRKRVERERGEIYQRTRADVLLEMLPVLDNFERALSSLENSEGDAEALHKGVELIHKQLKETLTKLGLQPVEAVGHSFDPNLHEAVTMEATDEVKENTVVEEFQRGYKVGDRLLRPAKVKVTTSPER